MGCIQLSKLPNFVQSIKRAHSIYCSSVPFQPFESFDLVLQKVTQKYTIRKSRADLDTPQYIGALPDLEAPFLADVVFDFSKLNSLPLRFDFLVLSAHKPMDLGLWFSYRTKSPVL